MWDMFGNSVKLFLTGKLFREPRAVLRQWVIGCAMAIGVLLLLVLGGAPVGFAVLASALVAGGMQPFLFKNLKYA
jgi:hypothetical protein